MITLRFIILILLNCLSNWLAAQCDSITVTRAIQEAIKIPKDCTKDLPSLLGTELYVINANISTWTNEIIKSPATLNQKVDYFNEIIGYCRQNAIAQSAIPNIYYEKGKWQYGRLDDLNGAIKSFSMAFEIEQSKIKTDSAFLSKCLSALGACQYYSGDIQSSEQTITKLIDENWPKSQKSLAGNLKTLGLIYRSKGNIPLAEQYFYQSGRTYAKFYNDSLHFVDHALNSIGVLYYSYSYYNDAIKTYQKALQILARADETSKKNTYLTNVIHNNLANAFSRAGRFSEALYEYELIQKSYKKDQARIGEVRTLLNIANLHMLLGNLDIASVRFVQLDSILRYEEYIELRSPMIDNQAQLYRIKKEFDFSFNVRKVQLKNLNQTSFNEIFGKTWKDTESEKLIQIGQLLPKISLIYRDRYREYRKSADLDSAMLMLTITQSILEQIKLNQLDPDYSADLGALNADLLEDVLSLYEDKPDWTDHYYTFFEKAKSASLLASIQSLETESLFRNKYPEIKKVHQIKIALDSIQDLLDITEAASIADEYRNRLLQLNQELVKANEAKQALLVSQNELINLYDHVELKELQTSLDDESCMLSYFINQAKDELFILYITNNHIELFNKKVYGQFTEDVFRLINMPTKSDAERSAWIKSNNRISELLLGDLLPLTPSQLNIIPDGILAYLPFEMLLTKEAESTESYAVLPYLIKGKSISYNFSASIWKEMSDKQTTGKGLLTMAPKFSMFTGIGNTNNPSAVPLAHAKKEVAAINSIFKSKYQPITKSEFIDQASQAQIVHFAGHAILNDNNPDNSYLAFSSSDDRENKLFIRDIYNMRTPNELVVLSACNTGQGELKKGEGVMSMARAFAYSGAKSLVYSLWDVNDGSTKKIMEHFYQELKAGATKDQALRTAKLAYMDSAKGAMQQPFYWAGFVAMGDMTPINIGGLSYWVYALGLFLGIGVVIFLYRRLA